MAEPPERLATITPQAQPPTYAPPRGWLLCAQPLRLRRRLAGDRARVVRFALVGGGCGVVQLGLLAALRAWGVQPLLANGSANLRSAQLSFVLSAALIWRDRQAAGTQARGPVRRWLVFHGSIAGTAALNQAVFVLARGVGPDVIAAGGRIAAAANFLVQDRPIVRGVRRGVRPVSMSTTRPLFAVVNASAAWGVDADPITLRRERVRPTLS